MPPDRKADRHDPDGPKGVFARLDPDDDVWFRKHIGNIGLSVSEGVKRAVRAYRRQVGTEAPLRDATEAGTANRAIAVELHAFIRKTTETTPEETK